MSTQDLEPLANSLVADGKGILAADESVATLTRRFDPLKIESTEQSRRRYREMLFTTPDVAAFISGVILYDETIRQKSVSGTPLSQVLDRQGLIPGIKVDIGAKPWKISFSYGRALQDPALEAWHGRDENVKIAQQALHHRARCNSATSLGRFTDDMETRATTPGAVAHR